MTFGSWACLGFVCLWSDLTGMILLPRVEFRLILRVVRLAEVVVSDDVVHGQLFRETSDFFFEIGVDSNALLFNRDVRVVCYRLAEYHLLKFGGVVHRHELEYLFVSTIVHLGKVNIIALKVVDYMIVLVVALGEDDDVVAFV